MAPSGSNVLNTMPSGGRVLQTNEKVTGPPGTEMLLRSGIHGPDEHQPLQIMDNACGGGILSAKLLKLAQRHPNAIKIQRVVASDLDETMVDHVKKRKEESSWQNVEVLQLDQQSVNLADETFSHVFNNFGVFFATNDEAVLSETLRILKPGGVAGFTSWKSIGWWPSVAQPAIASFIPEAPALPAPGSMFPFRGWDDPLAVFSKLVKAGFEEIQVSEYSFTTDVEAEEFAEASAVLVKAITARLWSEGERQKYTERIEPALLRYLRENFPNGKWNEQMSAVISIGKKSR